MRHRSKTVKLKRNASQRRALLANLACNLIEHGRIKTTLGKAKALRPVAEKMITLGKRGDLHARRLALAFLRQKDAVKKLFAEAGFLPEKLARTMTEEELPALDRPIRFTVLRGPRGAVRATTLAELQDLLDRPWSPEEVVRDEPSTDLTPRDERRVRELAGEFRRDKRPPRGRAARRGDGSGPRHRGPGGDGSPPRGRGPGGAAPRGRRRRGR